MSAGERAKELGCELPITLVAKIHGKNRDTLNKMYQSDPERFDRHVEVAMEKWNFICKNWNKITSKRKK